MSEPRQNIIRRGDGRIERVCAHGIGHTVGVPEKYKDQEAWWVHGCDGCCVDWEILKLARVGRRTA